MSNKIVPTVYHSIIDEVIGSLKPDFDEFGVGDEVLGTLRQKWEQRIHASRAADFSEPQASLAYNPQALQYNGIGSVATNPMGISRTNSPNINRTNSPASIVHSRAASRTNSIGASNQSASGSYTQGNYSATGSVANQGAGSVQVKAEPVDRFVPGGSGAHANQSYPFNPMGLRMPPNPAAVPGLGHLPPLPGMALDAYAASRGHPGYANATGAGGGGGAGSSILMLPRHAPTGYNGAAAKVPQVDGTWDEEVDEEALRRKRDYMIKRYPWMARAQMQSLDAMVLGDKIPQLDGPAPATSPIPPLNTLPPLNLPSSLNSGISRTGGPPPLTLPPLNLPADLASGSRAMHPSLMNKNPTPKEEDVKKEEQDIKRPPSTAPGASSSFARNPNVPAQPSEDINSELDDSEEEEGPHEQPGSDPDADVTYCTYDKVTRVKTKWKVVFRDGMVHANGKDYLFGRCTGEFDW